MLMLMIRRGGGGGGGGGGVGGGGGGGGVDDDDPEKVHLETLSQDPNGLCKEWVEKLAASCRPATPQRQVPLRRSNSKPPPDPRAAV